MKSRKDKIYNILEIINYKEYNNLVKLHNNLINSYNNIVSSYNNLSKKTTDFETIIFKNNPNIDSEDYIEKSNRFYVKEKNDPLLIAFYLPQFHTIKENDEWWGNGFTDWTNVTKAQPQFVGHYQPHLPDELGFYDLSNNDIFYKQVELAKKYGIHGFCFHYYWFSGKRLLEKPIFNYLEDKKLDFPFMLCWANEPWSRRWDGSEDDILMPQHFEEEDHLKFIEDIMPFFKDERYIKVDNCPILIIYKPNQITKKAMNSAVKIWEDYVKQNGFDGLYLLSTRTGDFDESPTEWGLNSTIEFPPNRYFFINEKNVSILNPDFSGRIYNLAKTIDETEKLSFEDYNVYKGVMPSWDNTARKKTEANIFFNSSPELYKKWLYNCLLDTKKKHQSNKQFVFINAWNEWAEGAHLEPDRKYGFAYLEATLDALEKSRVNTERYGYKDHYPVKVKYENYNKFEKKTIVEKKIMRPIRKNPYVYMGLKSKGDIKNFLNYRKIYDYLKDSKLFDEKYYLNKYPEVKKSGINPLLHYILIGNQDGDLPSKKYETIYNSLTNSKMFDEKYYLEKYPEVKKLGIDPISHYILIGNQVGNLPSQTFETIYNSLNNSKMFDEKYYLKNYPEVKNSGISPILQYITIGYKEGKNPSAKFDGNYYFETNNDVRMSHFNPLVHYISYGENEGRIIKSSAEDYKFTKYSDKDIDNILSVLGSEISIILYIDDDFEDAESSIDSIIQNTKINYELIIIDDNNSDNRIKTLLNNLDTNKNVKIIRNTIRLGFLKSVNSILEKSEEDVIILKSGVRVTVHWLQKLLVAAYSNEKIGVVSPLSDSVKFLEDILSKNTRLQNLKPDEISYLIENISEHIKPEISHPNESCIYIKKETINSVGLFNEDIIDLKKAKKSFFDRVLDNEWKIIIDDSTYVYQDEYSFDNDWNKKLESSFQIKELKEIIGVRADNLNLMVPKKRVLHILHENVHGLTGGTSKTTMDIIEEIDDQFECYILVSSVKELILWKKEHKRIIKLKTWNTKSQWGLNKFYIGEYKNLYFQILIALNIDLVHIQHLIGHTFDLPIVAKNLGIPSILSLHDFYYICPTIQLLNHDNQYCAGICANNNTQCTVPNDDIFGNIPMLSEFIPTWKEEVLGLLDNCETFTTPTKSTRDIYFSIYPELKNKTFNVIEHGRDFKKTVPNYEIPSEDKPIKILIPGIIKNHKGHDFIIELKKQDRQNRIELHFMGVIYDDLKRMGNYHGTYKREEFCRIVNEIKPSFIGIFSIWPETYCHTLTEAWSCGIPVLATKMGALEERIEKEGGGWFLDLKSPLNSYNQIIKISESDEEYLKVVDKVSKIHIKTINEMAQEYGQLYNKLLN